MKTIFIIILFILFLTGSVFLYLYFLFKLKFVKDMLYIVKYLKNNIQYTKDNINMILKKSYENINYISLHIIKNLDSNLDFFNKKLYKEFFLSLGQGDIDFELNNLNYYENLFEREEDIANENLSKKGILYSKLLIGLGLMVCIILL